MLIERTETLKFLVAFRPGLLSPTLAAQMAGTFQRHSEGRLLLNVVTGGEPHEQQAYGDFLDKQARYTRTAEFLHVVRQLWTSKEPVTFAGEHIHIEGAQLNNPPDPIPAVFFGGSSGSAGPVAANYSDVYLTWGEPLAAVREKLDWIRGLATEAGRTLQFGLRIHVISRPTAEEAWAEADRLLAAIDPADIERVQSSLARSESEGQRRMLKLHGGRSGELLIAPNLWAGVGLVRGGAGTALVGSHEEVAERLTEYADLGIDHFILSGYPHLEEAYWFGEGVLPLLERRGVWKHPNRKSQPASATPFAAASAQ
jgi:alkanesulfonate monooxygenase